MDGGRKALIFLAILASAGDALCGSALAGVPSRSHWKITARPVSGAYGLGEPIFFDLQVTNLRSEPASVDLGGDGKANLRVTTTEPNGLSRPVQLRHGGLQRLGKHPVGPHATYTERLILNEWNDLRAPGDYTAKIALVPEFGLKSDDPPTAEMHVSIGPRDESKLGAVAKALADRAIDGHGVADRSDAAFALSYVADPVAVPEMARVLASGRVVGSALVWALARLGGPSALDALQAAQSSPDIEVHDAAVQALQALRAGKEPVPPEIAD
jgi:hypothetical protein